jgi:hypothetical protein
MGMDDEAFCLFCEAPIDTDSDLGYFCQTCHDDAEAPKPLSIKDSFTLFLADFKARNAR